MTGMAHELADPLRRRCAGCEQVTPMPSNQITDAMEAFHPMFEPERARQLVRRIEVCYSPNWGGWLNVAECVPTGMARRFLRGHRIRDVGDLWTQIAAWPTDVSTRQRSVEWRMKTDSARCKLQSCCAKLIPDGPGGGIVHDVIVIGAGGMAAPLSTTSPAADAAFSAWSSSEFRMRTVRRTAPPGSSGWPTGKAASTCP